MCHTPPWTVIDHRSVLKPKKATRKTRSPSRPLSKRAINRQARPTQAPARAALMTNSMEAGPAAPKTATSGTKRSAGNGPNGT